ncbi:MAG: hypothetical protein ACPL4I_12895 [Bacteroidota bacterium]
MKRPLIAAAILLIHGFMEVVGVLSLFFPSYRPSFVFEELRQSWQSAVWVGAICGSLRLLAAAGILANRKWGWVLGVTMSVITFAMLTFYLPFGIIDALLAAMVLALLLVSHYGGARIVD